MNKNIVCVFLFEALPTNQVISVSRAWLCDSETSFIQLNVRKQRNVITRLTVSTVTGLARFIYSALNRTYYTHYTTLPSCVENLFNQDILREIFVLTVYCTYLLTYTP